MSIPTNASASKDHREVAWAFWIVWLDIILKAGLVTVYSFNETSYPAPPKQCQIIASSGVSTQPRVRCSPATRGDKPPGCIQVAVRAL